MDAEEVRRRRREKLLNRGKQVEEPTPNGQTEETQPTIAASIPDTQQDEQETIEKGIKPEAKAEPQVPQSKPKEEAPPVDFRQLFKLQEDHEKFKALSKANRFLFSILSGAWFHLLYHSFLLFVLTWKVFLIFDLGFIATLTYHEKVTYTRPINQLIWRSERRVKEREASLDADASKELKENKVSQSLDMLDNILKLTDHSLVKRLTGMWKAMQFLRGLVTDYLYYTLGVVLCDCLLKLVHDYGKS